VPSRTAPPLIHGRSGIEPAPAGLAVIAAAGAAAPGPATVRRNAIAPETGWPSAEVTRYRIV
jgi:hypothetical protein